MAVQSLQEQSIYFISATNNYDENAIRSNNLIQSLATNSAGNTLLISYETDWVWNGTAWAFGTLLRIRCFVSSAFQTTIQQNIPNLQSAFPQYTIVTYGNAVAFGN